MSFCPNFFFFFYHLALGTMDEEGAGGCGSPPLVGKPRGLAASRRQLGLVRAFPAGQTQLPSWVLGSRTTNPQPGTRSAKQGGKEGGNEQPVPLPPLLPSRPPDAFRCNLSRGATASVSVKSLAHSQSESGRERAQLQTHPVSFKVR